MAVLSLNLDGKIDLGPNWNFEYSFKSTNDSSLHPISRFDGNKEDDNLQDRPPKMIDIIIKNSKTNLNSARIGEAHIMIENEKINVERLNKEIEDTKPTTNLLNSTIKVIEHSKKDLEDKKNISKKRRTKKKHKVDTVNPTSTEKTHKKDKRIDTVIESLETFSTKRYTKSVPKLLFSDEHTNPPAKKKVKHPQQDDNKGNVRTDKPVTNTIIIEDFPEKRKTRSPKGVTSLDSRVNYDTIYVKPRSVKDDEIIRELCKHIYQQSINILENMQDNMTSYSMRKVIDHLKEDYEQKFGDFVKETQNHTIKTRLGRKKVILNTIDTSNRMLERMVNYLTDKMDYKGIARTSNNVLRNQLKKEVELENSHVCVKLGICRTKDSLTNFVSDIMTILISANDNKLKQAANAFSEVLREADLSHIMREEQKKHFNAKLDSFDQFDAYLIRPIFLILKNTMNNKNKPIVVEGPVDSRINKTMALFDIIDMLENHIPANDRNILFWNDMKNSFGDWKDGKRTDVEELVQSFIDHLIKATYKLDSDELSRLQGNVEVLFKT